MTEVKAIALCADDFAQEPSICDGILRLVDAGRLSAVSCFTDGPLWPGAGPALLERRASLLIGLHFNLTHPFGFGERPLRDWMVRCLLGRLDVAEVRRALERQLDRFVQVAGRLPDYVDGHQHVHVFPGIRRVVEEVVLSLPGEGGVRVRDLSRLTGRTDAPLKRAAIRLMTALGSRRPARAQPLNTGFAGDYSLSTRAPYARLMADWLERIPAGGLIMCHPRSKPPGARSTAADAEYAWLMSEGFPRLLAEHDVRLARTRADLEANDLASNSRPTGRADS